MTQSLLVREMSSSYEGDISTYKELQELNDRSFGHSRKVLVQSTILRNWSGKLALKDMDFGNKST